MAETITIARPYAQAVFALAREEDALAHWSEMLDTAAAVVGHQDMALLLGSPRLSTEERARLVTDICGEHLDEHGRNLVQVLADNGRVRVLPQIAELYRGLRAEAERTVAATLVTAGEVDEPMRERLAEALSRRLERKVTLTSEVNEDLIGGAVIHAGDLVIDGSVRGRLARLASALNR